MQRNIYANKRLAKATSTAVHYAIYPALAPAGPAAAAYPIPPGEV